MFKLQDDSFKGHLGVNNDEEHHKKCSHDEITNKIMELREAQKEKIKLKDAEVNHV